jgi:hypothetical protein
VARAESAIRGGAARTVLENLKAHS